MEEGTSGEEGGLQIDKDGIFEEARGFLDGGLEKEREDGEVLETNWDNDRVDCFSSWEEGGDGEEGMQDSTMMEVRDAGRADDLMIREKGIEGDKGRLLELTGGGLLDDAGNVEAEKTGNSAECGDRTKTGVALDWKKAVLGGGAVRGLAAVQGNVGLGSEVVVATRVNGGKGESASW